MTLTCSFGVGEREHGDTIDTLLKRADAALYEAKHGGRNRVVAADTIMRDLRANASSGVVRSAHAGLLPDISESSLSWKVSTENRDWDNAEARLGAAKRVDCCGDATLAEIQ